MLSTERQQVTLIKRYLIALKFKSRYYRHFRKIFGIKVKVEIIQFSYEHVKSQLMKD